MDRRQTLSERLQARRESERPQPFVAPWRRRQIEQAEQLDRQPGGRFVAVTDLTPTR